MGETLGGAPHAAGRQFRDGAIADLRLRLLGNGYEPVPIIAPTEPVKSAGKRPRLDAWASMDITPPAVRAWSKDYPRDINTGLRCGQLVGIDIDVLDEALAGEVEQMALAMLGTTPLRRIGRAPKLLLAYRAGEAMAKSSTPEFILPCGGKAQIEILAKGQQFVSHGIHPETRQPYTWTEAAPEDTPLGDVPALAPSRVRAFLAAAGAVIREHGGRTRKEIDAAEAPPRPPRPERPTSTTAGGFFREVNSLALADCDAWVRQVFPRARWQPNSTSPPGAWRVASEDLGRGLEEDISIHPVEGCQDFGTRQSRTPIDLVMEHAGGTDASKAALWLCEALGVDPQSLGWKGKAEVPERAAPPAPAASGVMRGNLAGIEPLPLLDPRGWTEPAPPRRWVVPDWVPSGVVTALYGDGGIGKTLAAQQLLTSSAIGAPWFGLDVMRGRTLGVFCEDDEDELQRRQEAINRALGATMGDLGEMRLLSRLGADNALVQFDGTQGHLTGFHAALRVTCKEWKPDLIVLDTAADLYPDNENDRSKVRWFIQTALAGLAREMACAVVLLAHPSASGLATGAGTGGSTAWNNTVRSRVYLAKEDGDAADAAARILSRKKANYAAKDASIRLAWRDGVLLRADAATAQDRVSWEVIQQMQEAIDRKWTEGAPYSTAVQTRGQGRYFPAWAARQFAMPEKKVAGLVSEWIMNGFLAIEMADAKQKKTGLRVVRWLEP